MHLHTLTDDELLRYAHTVHDDLTSTPLEVELLRRLVERETQDPQTEADSEVLAELGIALDHQPDVDLMTKALAVFRDFEAWPIAELLGILAQHDIDDAQVLDKALEAAKDLA